VSSSTVPSDVTASTDALLLEGTTGCRRGGGVNVEAGDGIDVEAVPELDVAWNFGRVGTEVDPAVVGTVTVTVLVPEVPQAAARKIVTTTAPFAHRGPTRIALETLSAGRPRPQAEARHSSSDGVGAAPSSRSPRVPFFISQGDTSVCDPQGSGSCSDSS
jgi:hypothetical protein